MGGRHCLNPWSGVLDEKEVTRGLKKNKETLESHDGSSGTAV